MSAQTESSRKKAAFGRCIKNRPTEEPKPVPGKRFVPISDGRWVMVSDADYPSVSAHLWFPSGNSSKRRGMYFATNIDNKVVHLHRFIMDPSPGLVVDHINGDNLDCSRENMRLVSAVENGWNRTKNYNSTSPYKGVSKRPAPPMRTKCWQASIVCTKRRIWLGDFVTPEDAAKAYDDAARKFFGGHAAVNFPREGERSCLRRG